MDSIVFCQILKPYLVNVCFCLCELPSVPSALKSSWQSDFSYNHGKTNSVSRLGNNLVFVFSFFFASFFFLNGEHTALLKGQKSQLQFL